MASSDLGFPPKSAVAPPAAGSPPLPVSVVIITQNRLPFLRACLDSLGTARPPAPREVVVVLNGPDPAARRWLEEGEGRRPGLVWVELTRSSKGEARNLGARRALGEWVYFLDDDVTIAPDLFEVLSALLRARPDVGAFGGPNLTPPASSSFQKGVGFALASRWGAGRMSARYRAGPVVPSALSATLRGQASLPGNADEAAALRGTGDAARYRPGSSDGAALPGGADEAALSAALRGQAALPGGADEAALSAALRGQAALPGGVIAADDRHLILCNLAVKRSLFQAVGGFRPDFFYNEENLLLEGLRRRGVPLMHTPALVVHHARRGTWGGYLAQVWRSGVGRGHMTRTLPGSLRWEHAVPTLFIVYLFSCLFLGGVWRVPAALYAAVTAWHAAVYFARVERSPRAAARAALLLVGGHVMYGAGFVAGFLRPRLNAGRVR